MKPITVFTPTKILNYQRLEWFKQTLSSFMVCTSQERVLYKYVVIDDSPQPFAQLLVNICEDYGIELIRDFCNTHRVFYAGVWKYMLESCQSPYLLFLPDDIFSIVQQDYLSPAIKAFEQHSDLYEINFQCVFSAWNQTIGSPVYFAKRFYEKRKGYVETVQATRLYPFPINTENTLWKTSLEDSYRGVGESLCLNHSLLRVEVLRQYPLPSPHWLSDQRKGKRLFSWCLKKLGLRLITSPAEIELFFLDHPDLNRKYNSAYLNMQTFSYTPDHQISDIDDLEAFKQVNSARLLS
jgi:hypothetical protein